MVTFLYVILSGILVSFYPTQAERDNREDIVQKLNRADWSVFASDYLREGFESWRRQEYASSFVIDTSFSRGSDTEVWLRYGASPEKMIDNIVLLISTPAAKVIDVRKGLFQDVSRFAAVEVEVLRFVERLLWTYETGEVSFFQDLFYPEFVTIRFAGASEPADVFEALQAKYVEGLSIQNVNWSNEGFVFTIDIEPGANPLAPIQVEIDMQKYLTVLFFDISDKQERVQALRDSITVWLKDTGQGDGANFQSFNPEFELRSISKLLEILSATYQVTILERERNTARIEIRLPKRDQFFSPSLRYRLEAARSSVSAAFLGFADEEISKLLLLLDPEIRNANDQYHKQITDAISDIMLRFHTLGLPAIFQQRVKEGQSIAGEVTVQHVTTITSPLQSTQSYGHLLSKLTENKKAYFAIRSLRVEDERLHITGYALWLDRNYHWHHFAVVEESYDLQDGLLTGVSMTLYPFVRTESLSAMYVAPSAETGRKQIRIKR